MMFTGDAQGNLVTCIFYNTSGSMEARKENATYTYIFDAQGNWIKQTKDEQSNDQGRMTRSDQSILTRTITYYP